MSPTPSPYGVGVGGVTAPWGRGAVGGVLRETRWKSVIFGTDEGRGRDVLGGGQALPGQQYH